VYNVGRPLRQILGSGASPILTSAILGLGQLGDVRELIWPTSSMAEQLTLNQWVQGSSPWSVT
jgi:hypothetical protein